MQMLGLGSAPEDVFTALIHECADMDKTYEDFQELTAELAKKPKQILFCLS